MAMMKVTCLTDSLWSGGAQRQLCTLAALLKRRGIDVSVLTYHRYEFFLPLLQESGIPYTCVESRSIPGRALALRHALRHGRHDVVLAFQEAPSLYAELAAMPRRSWGLVVSERSAGPQWHTSLQRQLYRFHRVADYITTNSHASRLQMARFAPGLALRMVTVYNAVSQDAFYDAPPLPRKNSRPLRIVAAGSYQANKNVEGFVHAIALARTLQPSARFQLDWYGSLWNVSDSYHAAERAIAQHDLSDRVRLHPASDTIAEEYRKADVVALPSFYEGLPNTVCEAMACGRPILMSDVCDSRNLVKHGYNGLLFDPVSAGDMARALLDFAALSTEEREQMGRRSRAMAERMFDPEVFAARYAEILTAAANLEHRPIEHWIPEVPESACLSPL
jgi:glycosyltransferase involved in cell wall biosynthesis